MIIYYLKTLFILNIQVIVNKKKQKYWITPEYETLWLKIESIAKDCYIAFGSLNMRLTVGVALTTQ